MFKIIFLLLLFISSNLFAHIDLSNQEKKDKNIVNLTLQQREYLKNKKVITMCIDPDWLPYEAFDANGKYIGIASDIYKIFSKQLNIEFKPIQVSSWQESLNFAKQRKCDIFSLAMQTPKRKKYMNFTQAYLDLPMVLATKSNVTYITNIKELYGKKNWTCQRICF